MQPFNGKGPATVSPLVLRVIDELHQGATGSRESVTQAVVELSRLFTKERAALNRSYLEDPVYAAAYLAYFLPVNLSKIQVLLDELPQEGCAERRSGRLSILDLGSGPGTGALAVLDWWHRRHPARAGNLSVIAVDHAQAALRHAEHLWEQYCRTAGMVGPKLQTCEGNLAQAPKGLLWLTQIRQGAPYDLILLANCLNEIHTEAPDPIAARTGLVSEMLQLVAPHGTVMVVEPALRETSRALHQLRDRLLQEKRCTIYSPCLHEENCPALVHPGDWCHEERAWHVPASIQEIDQDVGFIKDALKFSYLLLRKDGRTIVPRNAETFRIVSELRELKGDTRAWVCNELGRSEIGRLDRAKSESNSMWEECQRGTIVKVEGLKRKEGRALARIPEEGTVQIIHSV